MTSSRLHPWGVDISPTRYSTYCDLRFFWSYWYFCKSLAIVSVALYRPTLTQYYCIDDCRPILWILYVVQQFVLTLPSWMPKMKEALYTQGVDFTQPTWNVNGDYTLLLAWLTSVHCCNIFFTNFSFTKTLETIRSSVWQLEYEIL